MTSIHAELVAGQESIVLLAGGLGDPEEVALAAKRLKTLTPLFSKSDPPGALVVPASWPAVVQLSATFGDAFVPGPQLRAWISAEATRRTTPDPLLYTPPPGLTPYPWQVSGGAMIAAAGGALITDEPGTGKTITSILGLVGLIERHGLRGPVLVICPASVVDAWVEAWCTWAPHVRAVAWMGPKRHRFAGNADVFVTSYETARSDTPPLDKPGPLTRLAPAAVVIDECHYIKNATSARSKAVVRLCSKATSVVALSGTPITRDTGDLFPTLQAMIPGAYPSSERWRARYVHTLAGDYRDEVLGLNPYTEPEFRLAMLGQHRRVAKVDVLTELPPKVYSVRTVELPAAWRKAYNDFEADMFAELPVDETTGEAQELSVMQAMTVWGHLTRLAAAPCDVEITFGPDLDEHTGEPKKHVHLHLKDPSWKVAALLELLNERRDSTAPGEKRQQTVVFAPSKQLVALAGAAAEKAGYRVGYVIGGQARGKRTETVASFQAGHLDVLCVTTSAGGTGVTFTAASCVVFLQRPWGLDESIQAEDRCHRIGSEIHDSIEVIDIVARNTIESRVRAKLRGKASQLAELLQDPRIVADLLGGTTTTERKAS